MKESDFSLLIIFQKKKENCENNLITVWNALKGNWYHFFHHITVYDWIIYSIKIWRFSYIIDFSLLVGMHVHKFTRETSLTTEKGAKNKVKTMSWKKYCIHQKAKHLKKGRTQFDTLSLTSTRLDTITCPLYYQSTLTYLTIFNLIPLSQLHDWWLGIATITDIIIPISVAKWLKK